MKKLLLLLVCLVGLAGCTDAQVYERAAAEASFRVTVYSGGVAVKTYKSTGKVSTESQSDGRYFRDAGTGKLVRVSGTMTIEEY